jgi:hypothetical protein
VLGFVSSTVMNLVAVTIAGTPHGLEASAAIRDDGAIALVTVGVRLGAPARSAEPVPAMA